MAGPATCPPRQGKMAEGFQGPHERLQERAWPGLRDGATSRCDVHSHRAEESAAPGEAENPQKQPLQRTPEPLAHMPARPAPGPSAPDPAQQPKCLLGPSAPAPWPDGGPWGVPHLGLGELRPPVPAPEAPEPIPGRWSWAQHGKASPAAPRPGLPTPCPEVTWPSLPGWPGQRLLVLRARAASIARGADFTGRCRESHWPAAPAWALSLRPQTTGPTC